jgi:hypothetical protein
VNIHRNLVYNGEKPTGNHQLFLAKELLNKVWWI